MDSQFVDQKTRRQDTRYLTVKGGKGGVEIPGLVRRQPGGFFNSSPATAWFLKATEPGDYEVWAEWRPPGGEELNSARVPIKVVSEFAGTYKGSVRYPSKPGRQPVMQTFDFTVDGNNIVEGRFSFGDSEEFYSGTFSGIVLPQEGSIAFEKGRLEADGTMTRDLERLPPGLMELIEAAQEQMRQLREYLRSAGDASAEAQMRALETQVEADQQTLLRDAGVVAGPIPVKISMDFRSVGGILKAEGTLADDQRISYPVSATAFSAMTP